MKSWVYFIFAPIFILVGCATLTPEQQEKADKAKAAYTEAAAQLMSVEDVVNAHVAEYEVIKKQIDSGVSVPAAVAVRYSELRSLLVGDLAKWKELKAAYDDAKKAAEEAAAEGVPWHASIPWGMLGTLILGVAGTYFPIARPATLAAQAVIRGVSELSTSNPGAGEAAKGKILDAARVLGIEAKLDALVQKFDPPK